VRRCLGSCVDFVRAGHALASVEGVCDQIVHANLEIQSAPPAPPAPPRPNTLISDLLHLLWVPNLKERRPPPRPPPAARTSQRAEEGAARAGGTPEEAAALRERSRAPSARRTPAAVTPASATPATASPAAEPRLRGGNTPSGLATPSGGGGGGAPLPEPAAWMHAESFEKKITKCEGAVTLDWCEEVRFRAPPRRVCRTRRADPPRARG